MSRFGFDYVLRKHVQTAAQCCASLQKKQVSPHVLRHASAMLVLQATGDIRKVSLWLGHANLRTTEIYLRADPTEKLDAMVCAPAGAPTRAVSVTRQADRLPASRWMNMWSKGSR